MEEFNLHKLLRIFGSLLFRWWFTVTCIILSFHVHAQKFVDVQFSLGKIPRHNPQLIVDPWDGTAWEIGLNYASRKFEPSHWRKTLGYPEIGWNVGYHNFGNNDIYGSGISLYPSLRIFWREDQPTSFYLKLGTGVVYHNKTYYSENLNRGIGSNLNNISSLSFGVQKNLIKTALFADLGVTHFSNAAVRQPNLGLNIIRVNLGIKFRLSPMSQEVPDLPVIINTPNRNWGLGIKVQVGFFDYEERQFDPENKYAGVYALNVYTIKPIGSLHRLQSGLKYSYNHGRRLRNGKDATHVWAIYLGDELLLGKVSIYGQAGLYLRQRYSDDIIYTEFGINYYFSTQKNGFHLGVSLKNHLQVAEYPEMSLGYVF